MAAPVSFYLVTDTHCLAPELCEICDAYREYMSGEQMCLAENSAIIRATFDEIAKDKQANIVIIPGDLSKNGEKASHKHFISELNRLKAAGKRVYVITARHDFNSRASAFVGGGWAEVEGTEKSELKELYYEFGYSDAVAVDAQSMSYVAQIAPGIRMLALDSDGEPDGHNKGSFDERLLAWIDEQIKAARESGCFVFAINHYPILPPSPIFALVGDARMKEWQSVASFLADRGVPLAFTGHMHIQSINDYTSPASNRLYDVCTSALVGSPAMYRRVTLDGEKAEISTLKVPAFDWDTEGLTNDEYFTRQFKNMMVNRLNRLLSGGRGIAKLGKRLGKRVINTITVGGVARLLWIRVDKTLRRRRLLEVATDIGVALFAGDAPYVEGTPEHAAVSKALNRLGFIIKKLEKKLNEKYPGINLKKTVLDTLGNNKGYSERNTTLLLK